MESSTPAADPFTAEDARSMICSRPRKPLATYRGTRTRDRMNSVCWMRLLA